MILSSGVWADTIAGDAQDPAHLEDIHLADTHQADILQTPEAYLQAGAPQVTVVVALAAALGLLLEGALVPHCPLRAADVLLVLLQGGLLLCTV